jgi:hypothetical protein
MKSWLWLFLGLSVVFGCDIDSDDDDDDGDRDASREDGAIPPRDAATRDSAVVGDSAVARDTGVDDDSGSDEGDEDAGGGGIECGDNNGGLELPAGFCAVVFADGLGRARHIAVTPAGDVYVAVANAPDGSTEGSLVALRDADGDGRADRTERFGETGGHGVTWLDGELYFGQNDRVLRYDLPSGQLVPTADPVTIVSGLPATPDHYH